MPPVPRLGIEHSKGGGNDAAPIAVILAERDVRARLRLRQALAADDRISVVADTRAASTAAQLALQHPVGVLVFGSSMGLDEVLAAVDTVRQRAPEVRSLVLMEGHDEQEEYAFLMVGAAGVLPSGAPPARLPAAVRALHAGEAVVPPGLLTFLVRHLRRVSTSRRTSKPVLEPLSSREWQIIDELTAGRPTAAVAKRLGIAPATVHSHLRNIYGKLGVRSRTEALAVAEHLRSGGHRRPFGASAALWRLSAGAPAFRHR